MGYSVPPIPESLRENLAYGLGEVEAQRWLEHAVERAAELFDRWDLVPEEVLTGGSESLCVKCQGPDGSAQVLKLPASLPGGAAEIAALRAWRGAGAARVLRQDPAQSAMLMNFLGWVGEDSFTLAEVLDLADRLHLADASSYDFPAVDANVARRVAWAEDRFAEAGLESAQADLVVAQKVLADLLSTDEPQVLLHGDLQPKNLIVSGAGLAVVDPLPAVGPAIFDVAFWVVKCTDGHPLTSCQDHVLELRPQLDAEALVRWCWALAVLEHRPYLAERNAQRQDYIDSHRERVL